MIFFDYFRSSAGFRVRIALRLKRLDAERRSVHLRKGEQHDSGYLAVTPQGLVPALVLDDGAVLTQSLAIIEYLDTLSAEIPLIPEDSLEAARVRQLSQLIACELHPLNNLRILNYLKEPLGHNQGEVNSWYQHWEESGITAFERLIAEYAPNAHYCLGNFLTMASSWTATNGWPPSRNSRKAFPKCSRTQGKTFHATSPLRAGGEAQPLGRGFPLLPFAFPENPCVLSGVKDQGTQPLKIRQAVDFRREDVCPVRSDNAQKLGSCNLRPLQICECISNHQDSRRFSS